MANIKAAIIGAGFIGPAHIEAIRRLGYVDVVAIAEPSHERAIATADRMNIPKAYGNYEKLLLDPEIQVVHNCTPNHMHFKINRDAILAKKHIISEKPLALDIHESAELSHLAKQYGVVCAINFNYRMYPMVQQMRASIEKQAMGQAHVVYGQYLQDWLLFDTDYNWRMLTHTGGRSRAVADIGSHWIDLVQHITGQKVTEVMADMVTLLPNRRMRSGMQTFDETKIETEEYEEIRIDTEDYASILIRFENGLRGALTVSQMSAGRKNCLTVQVDCSHGSMAWNQEDPDKLWIGHRGRPNEVMMADPSLVYPEVRDYIHYPGGHTEGWPDGLKNVMSDIYAFIRDGKNPLTDRYRFSDFEDGHTTMLVVGAILQSHQTGKWVSVKDVVIDHARMDELKTTQ